MKVIRTMIWLILTPLLIESIVGAAKTSKVEGKSSKRIKKSKTKANIERELHDMDYGSFNQKHKKNKAPNHFNEIGKKKTPNRKLQNYNGNVSGNNNNAYGQNNPQGTGQYGGQQGTGQYGGQQGTGQYGRGQYGYQVPKPEECDLSVEIFPLYYTPVIRASTFRLAFSSNCLTKRDINFEVYYKNKDNINFNHNPTIINLDIWGNYYNITYSKPNVVDPFDVMRSLEYREANITNLLDNQVIKLDVMSQNEVFLNPQLFATFNKYNINKIKNLNGLVRCELFEKKVHGWELLKRIKEDAKKRREAQRKQMDDVIKKTREETEEYMKMQAKQLKDSSRSLAENGFSFYKPPHIEDMEENRNRDPDTYFPDEDLDKYGGSESGKGVRSKEEKIRVEDRNSVWGYSTNEPSDYYDDNVLPLEAEAPLAKFESHKQTVQKLMKREFVEEYRILCKFQ